MFVKEVMSLNPTTVNPETTFYEAMNIIRSKGIRRLPVVKGRKIVGIITEKDLLSASPSKATTLDVWELTNALNQLKVKQIMVKEVVFVRPNTPIEEAARLMSDKKIGSLPVVKEENLVGIITETDIFKVFIKLFGARKHGIRFVFTTANVPGVLSRIVNLAYRCGGNILSVATYQKNEDEYSIVMKVKDIDKDDFERKFSEAIPSASIIDAREM